MPLTLTTTTARNRVKSKLDIAAANTSFDTLVDEAIEDALPRLAPWFSYEMPEDTSITLSTGDDKFTVPTGNPTIQKVYVRTSDNNPWQELEYWVQHGSVVYLNENIGTATDVKLLATRTLAYNNTDLGLLPAAAWAVLWSFACAEFYVSLVGNKRKFNLYQEGNGVRSVAEMRELVEWHEARAAKLAEDAVSADGL